MSKVDIETSKVILRSAPPGTGIIAGGPMRAVFETLGVQDVVSKSIGSSSPYNMVRATFNGLQNIQSPRNIAARRGLKVSSIFGKSKIEKKQENKRMSNKRQLELYKLLAQLVDRVIRKNV